MNYSDKKLSEMPTYREKFEYALQYLKEQGFDTENPDTVDAVRLLIKPVFVTLEETRSFLEKLNDYKKNDSDSVDIEKLREAVHNTPHEFGEKYQCPCCGYYTLNESPGGYDICEICFWEDEEILDPREESGSNHCLSLLEARDNYLKYGAVADWLSVYTRKAYNFESEPYFAFTDLSDKESRFYPYTTDNKDCPEASVVESNVLNNEIDANKVLTFQERLDIIKEYANEQGLDIDNPENMKVFRMVAKPVFSTVEKIRLVMWRILREEYLYAIDGKVLDNKFVKDFLNENEHICMERYQCPCCGYFTLDWRPGSISTCPVCLWVDDRNQKIYPAKTDEDYANDVSLLEAQENYLKYGAKEERYAKYVRKPYNFEQIGNYLDGEKVCGHVEDIYPYTTDDESCPKAFMINELVKRTIL